MHITRHSVQIETSPSTVAYSRLKSGGLNAHFFPATAYTFGCYRQLLTLISQSLNLVGMDIRPTWPDIGPPPIDHNWDIYLDDLIAFLDALDEGPVVGIGHSLGGITSIRAAVRRPDLFRAIILLEPALYPPSLIRIANIMPWSIKSKRPPVSSALNRKDTWTDKQEVFHDLRSHKIFSRFSDETLNDFLDYGLTSNGNGNGNGCKLKFRKDWEARIYGEPPFFWNEFQKLTIPVLGIKGQKSERFLERQWKRWKKMRKEDTQERIENATHLLPLESPEETATVIMDWLEKTNI